MSATRARGAWRIRRPAALRRALAAIAVASLASAAARADEVLVAVAANFAGTLASIAEGFTAVSGHTLRISSGATGRFYSQIVAGAPYEVLLAADEATPKRLVAEGRAVAGSGFTYAIGQLVLWSAQPGLVDDQGAVLSSGRFRHLAIANPGTAPYGQAAMDVLRSRGLAQALAPRLVTAQSVAQAFQFATSGNAELGFVALAQVAPPGRPATGSLWRVPPALHRALRQDAVLLAPGARKPAARALLAYLGSAPARTVIQAHGYGL